MKIRRMFVHFAGKRGWRATAIAGIAERRKIILSLKNQPRLYMGLHGFFVTGTNELLLGQHLNKEQLFSSAA